jgi:hypothetical protein
MKYTIKLSIPLGVAILEVTSESKTLGGVANEITKLRKELEVIVGKEKPVPKVDANVNDDGPGFSPVRPRN